MNDPIFPLRGVCGAEMRHVHSQERLVWACSSCTHDADLLDKLGAIVHQAQTEAYQAADAYAMVVDTYQADHVVERYRLEVLDAARRLRSARAEFLTEHGLQRALKATLKATDALRQALEDAHRVERDVRDLVLARASAYVKLLGDEAADRALGKLVEAVHAMEAARKVAHAAFVAAYPDMAVNLGVS